MELNNFNFIQAQSIFNQSVAKAVSKLGEDTKSAVKTARKAKAFSKFGLIFSAVAVAAVVAEMKLQKEETDRKIERLEEEIRELERGD